MTASWSTVITQLPPAFLGQPYQAALPVVGAAASSANALALATGDSGMPTGLAIETTDYVGITGTPTGALSTGHEAGSQLTGADQTYTFTLTNGATTQKFSILLLSAQSDPFESAAESVANQAATREGVDQ